MESVTNFLWHEESEKGDDGVANELHKSLGRSRKNSKSKPKEKGSTGAAAMEYETGNSGIQKIMTDAVVEKLMSMALPPATEIGSNVLEQRIENGRDRPRLSVPVMSRNFIQTNARLGLPFKIVDDVMDIFNWCNPAYTLSVMMLYTFTILKPLPTLSSLPLLYILFGVMVPQYMYLHKPEVSPYFDSNPNPAQGPPLRNAVVPQPASELSQEFVLNLTDLQNHMLLFVCTYDFFAMILETFAYFTNEITSSAAFMALLIIAVLNCLFIEPVSAFIPWKIILISLGWFSLYVLHPATLESILIFINSEDTRYRFLNLTNKYKSILNSNLKVVEPAERRLVAIFELQTLKKKKEWISLGFSNDNFTLFSTLRISECDIKDHCELELKSVKPPTDWEWFEDSKWFLDLSPSTWVENEFVQYAEIDTETKWVYDLNIDGTRGKYRRRMWNRLCVRKADKFVKQEDENDDELNVEEVFNPLHVEKYDADVYGVSMHSFRGHKNDTEIKKTKSNDGKE